MRDRADCLWERRRSKSAGGGDPDGFVDFLHPFPHTHPKPLVLHEDFMHSEAGERWFVTMRLPEVLERAWLLDPQHPSAFEALSPRLKEDFVRWIHSASDSHRRAQRLEKAARSLRCGTNAGAVRVGNKEANQAERHRARRRSG